MSTKENLKYTHHVLLVDDEPSILKALTRTLRRLPCTLHTASGGPEALCLLEESRHAFSLILSDQRMPEMDGATFLEKSRKFYPYASRILLTGYSDLEALTRAINLGGIHRFLSKPWEDDTLIQAVTETLQQYEVILENKKLQIMLSRQNQELEAKIQQRTADIQKQNESLSRVNQMLEDSFYSTVRLLASLVDRSAPELSGHGRRVSEMAAMLARHMELDAEEILHIEVAGLLHDIGKVGGTPGILRGNPQQMSKEDFQHYRKHPEEGQSLLQLIPRLDHVGILIRCHHERYDGQGFPNGLSEQEIPMGARILSVADAYDRYLHIPELSAEAVRLLSRQEDSTLDHINSQTLKRQAAAAKVKQDAFSRHDPDVVKALLDLLKNQGLGVKREKSLILEQMEPGMKLARPLYTVQGRFLLPYNTIITKEIMQRLNQIHKNEAIQEPIQILPA
ncbi:response regulator RpfG family c-di-GMP phosphodiesterase [Desulfobotulus alkaliphilus]|uniref:Response regulator RpfG family c-di-GMP phosphodiesterase n=1 Tax=Desulfobotulus alkaliphilus TaxID=622671 RepID=A0A562S6R1_9BACT|nr:HD domain-containing phosphohydrolase [Desulfobotulus alkaliphilus]TWI76803.1 response regulator RpfG family c-di-GMP phosphodiesterase [Desulfobotulus alkaliphilus]